MRYPIAPLGGLTCSAWPGILPPRSPGRGPPACHATNETPPYIYGSFSFVLSTAGAGRDHPKMARGSSHSTPLRLVPGLHGRRVRTMRRPHGRALGRAGDITRAGPTACTKTRRAELGMFNKAVAMRLLSPGLAPWWLMPFLAGQSELVFCADGMRVFFWAAGFGRGPVSENSEKRCVFSPPLLNKKWPISQVLKKRRNPNRVICKLVKPLA